MAWTNVPIPDGFIPYNPRGWGSSISWAAEFWVRPAPGKSGTSAKHLVPPSGSKFIQMIDPRMTEGTVDLVCYVRYKLVKPVNMSFPQIAGEGSFMFGCSWPFSFVQGQMIFGPDNDVTSLSNPGTSLLSGSCDHTRSKDQNGPVNAFVSAVPLLQLKATSDYQGWSLQAPIVGGPSYTPQGNSTPADKWPLANFWVEFQMPQPITITSLLDPGLPLAVTLNYLNDNDRELKDTELALLFAWMDRIKNSNVMPVIKKQYVRIKIQTHASKSGTPVYNMKLTMERGARLKWYIEQKFGSSTDVDPDPRGDLDAGSLTGIKRSNYNAALRKDRYVTISIDPAEATAAFTRDQKTLVPSR